MDNILANTRCIDLLDDCDNDNTDDIKYESEINIIDLSSSIPLF